MIKCDTVRYNQNHSSELYEKYLYKIQSFCFLFIVLQINAKLSLYKPCIKFKGLPTSMRHFFRNFASAKPIQQNCFRLPEKKNQKPHKGSIGFVFFFWSIGQDIPSFYQSALT
jgi:hypothetical protein